MMRLANCLHASGVCGRMSECEPFTPQAVCDIVNFLTMGAGEWGNELSDNCAN